MVFSSENEWIIIICNSMDELYKYYIVWNKLDKKKKFYFIKLKNI